MEGLSPPAAWQPSPHLLFFRCKAREGAVEQVICPICFLNAEGLGFGEPFPQLAGFWGVVWDWWILFQQNEDTRHTLPEIFWNHQPLKDDAAWKVSPFLLWWATLFFFSPPFLWLFVLKWLKDAFFCGVWRSWSRPSYILLCGCLQTFVAWKHWS